MADLLTFPAPRRPSCAISSYRAYRFAPDGSVRSTRLIEAQVDAEAGRAAPRKADLKAERVARYLARKVKVQRCR